MHNQSVPFYKAYLRDELARRCDHNTNYSMRSFARALEVDPAVLSRTLADKRALSYKVANRMVRNLCLSPKESQIFLESVAEDQKQRGLRKSATSTPSPLPTTAIDSEKFRIISDWYHYAIQQLTFVEGFKSDPRWIAKRLGITVLEVKLALQRLIATGLIQEINGRYVACDFNIDLKDKKSSSPAARKYQKQILQKALHSLENDPISERSTSSMTMPIDPAKLPLAQEMIQDFREQLSRVLSAGNKTALYQLSISLFPLEKGE